MPRRRNAHDELDATSLVHPAALIALVAACTADVGEEETITKREARPDGQVRRRRGERLRRAGRAW